MTKVINLRRCPDKDCRKWSPLKNWKECEVSCDQCGEHPASKCPICGEVFDDIFYDGEYEETMYNLVEAAKEFATKAHQGQHRWDGKTPYITHPEAVADNVETPEEKAVAWLHDVVEDTKVTLDDLREAGFPEEVVFGVGAMTNPKRENTYLEYLKTVMDNPIALNVKIADITHNMSTMPKEKKRQSLYAKYELALYILEHHAGN